MKPQPAGPSPKDSFLIDMEHFEKKLNEGVWGIDGFDILDQLIKPVPGGLMKEEEDEG